MMVFEDIHAVRSALLAEVEENIQDEAAKQTTIEATKSLCNDWIIKAFVKARVFPKGPNSNHRRMADNFATDMANRLFVR